MSGIPEEWVECELGDIAKWGSGGTPSRKILAYYEGNIPWIKTGDLGPKIILKATESITEEAIQNSSAKYFLKNSVILAMYGATIGKTSILGIDATTNQACAVGTPQENKTTALFLYYLLKNEKDNFIAKGKGGAQPNISQQLIKSHKIILPSLPEQNEITSRLERLLGQVDGIKKRIDGIPAILKSFRQSVLSAAVSGKLTEEWREENQFNTIKNIRVLNIAERKKMQKYKQPKKLESKIHFILDSTWQLISMDEACIKITDGTHHSPKSFSEGDYMYVTSKNVREGYIDLKKITYVDTTTHIEIYSRCDVIKGDVLFVKDGANTGLACVNNIEEEISLLSSVGVLRTTSYVVPKFLEFYLNSPFTRRIMYSMMGGTAIKRLTLTKIMSLPFPLPPIEEQKEIVKRVESSFALADSLELKIKEAQKRVNHLTQSILAKAFCGDLTKEWRELNRDLITGDNSAFALLERIKEERETLKVTKTGKKPLKKKDDKVLVAAENGGRYG